MSAASEAAMTARFQEDARRIGNATARLTLAMYGNVSEAQLSYRDIADACAVAAEAGILFCLKRVEREAKKRLRK
jgi:hypothetical protein